MAQPAPSSIVSRRLKKMGNLSMPGDSGRLTPFYVSTAAGFGVRRVHRLRLHYARALDMWAADLVARCEEATTITSETVYERYLRYLTGCADFFRRGITDVGQFTLVKR